MHFPSALATTSLLLPTLSSALSIPSNQISDLATRESSPNEANPLFSTLEKRRGGGGGGGRGGGSSGGSSSGSSGSSGGTSSGGTSSSGSTSGGSSSGSTSGSSGGRSGSGSTGVTGGGTTSATPKYSGSSGSGYYAGGASTPYRAGATSGSITPILAGSALGFGAGALLYGGHPFYYYPYSHPYYYNNSGHNDSLPVECTCAQYNPCGCSDQNNQDLITQQINDGTANITTVNGTKTVVINGTLDNGTDTSSTGGDSPTSAASARMHLTAAAPVAVVAALMVLGL